MKSSLFPVLTLAALAPLAASSADFAILDCHGAWSRGVSQLVARVVDARTIQMATLFRYQRGKVATTLPYNKGPAHGFPYEGSMLAKKFPPAGPDYGVKGTPIAGPVLVFNIESEDGVGDWNARDFAVPADFATRTQPFDATYIRSGGDQDTSFNTWSCYVDRAE
jgi:hypothetical protein